MSFASEFLKNRLLLTDATSVSGIAEEDGEASGSSGEACASVGGFSQREETPKWSELKAKMIALIDRELREKQVTLDGLKDKVNKKYTSNSLKIIFNEVNSSISCIRRVTRDFDKFIESAMAELNEKSDALFTDVEEYKQILAENEAKSVARNETSKKRRLSTDAEESPRKQGKINKRNLNERLPYKCLVCFHRFGDLSSFKTHKQMHEELQEDGVTMILPPDGGPTNELSLICAVCNRSFAVTLARGETIPPMKACNICCYFFNSAKDAAFTCMKNGESRSSRTSWMLT